MNIVDTIRAKNLSENLRFLCERHGTTSSVCQRIKINRQQFNKYLSGVHVPSVQNQRLIANFFGLSRSMLFTDPEEFRALMEGNYFHTLEALRNLRHMASFLKVLLVENQSSGETYIGVYDRYQYSSVYKGKILRSAYCIYKSQGFLQHYYIERFPNLDNQRGVDLLFKYHGFTIPLDGRVFSLDFEVTRKHEMTFGIYAPVQRSSKSFLMGIAGGISETMLRPPYSTKVAMHFCEPGLLKREHLECVTVLEKDNPSIPAEIRHYLDSHD